jgi:excisionase family DNA binding protein
VGERFSREIAARGWLLELAALDHLLTVDDAAGIVQTSRRRMYSILESGSGPPHLRIGRNIRIRPDALAAWIESAHVDLEGWGA